MPKRTNEFQKFVALIESLAAEPSTKVIESSMQSSRAGDGTREVDILLEQTINGVLVRMAIECRDHSRKQDVAWIDELIGKYENLDVDVVIAVSSSGFTKGARIKAAHSNIRAFTLQEAEDDDASGVVRTDLSFFEADDKLIAHGVRLSEGEPAIADDIDISEYLLETRDGDKRETFESVSRRMFFSEHNAAVLEYSKAAGVKSGDKPLWYPLRFCVEKEVKGCFLVIPGEQRRSVQAILLLIDAIVGVTPAEQKHFTYESKRALVATVGDSVGGSHRITLVQVLGTSPPQIRWHYVGTGMDLTTLHTETEARGELTSGMATIPVDVTYSKAKEITTGIRTYKLGPSVPGKLRRIYVVPPPS